MKKILRRLPALCLMICLAACGYDTPTAIPTPAVDGHVFHYNGHSIVLHDQAGPVLAALGEPKAYTEKASCAFEGKDKTYYFGSFYLQTYPVGEQDYVYSLWFADDSVITDEGAYIGMTQPQIEAIYGARNENDPHAYIVTKADTRLTILLTDGVVSSIQYDALIGS